MKFSKLKYGNREKTIINAIWHHPLHGDIPYTMDIDSFNQSIAGDYGDIAQFTPPPEPTTEELETREDAEAKRKAEIEARQKAQATPLCSCKAEVDLLKKEIEALKADMKALKEGQSSQPSPAPQPTSKAAKPAVNVNKATALELEPLPYIGLRGANNIVAMRNVAGFKPFIDHNDFKSRTYKLAPKTDGYDFTSAADMPLITF